MKKSSFIAVIALLVSIIGVLIALVAYFKRKKCALCDDYEDDLDLLDDDDLDYYASEMNADHDGCDCEHDEASDDAKQADVEPED